MSVLGHDVRSGTYLDSIVLMQLERALADLPGVAAAGVVMATPANASLLRANDLWPEDAERAGPDDLLVVVRAEDDAAARDALGQVDALLARRSTSAPGEYRPRSLQAAVRQVPEARWVLVSVPGRWAAGVAHDALDLGRHVFLFSDNVSLDDEVALKRKARDKGLLVMGPDCGTALVGGVGLGFANRVRRGTVGLVAASGTGLQAVACRLHELGAGVSHALGTGGRDLGEAVGAISALQGLDLLARDPDTRVIVLVSKPPAPAVAARLLRAAQATGKPVVVDFLGQPPPARRLGNLHFAADLGHAADLAAALLDAAPPTPQATPPARGRWLRGLFSGGTLAQQALLALRPFLDLRSNVKLDGVAALEDPHRSTGHTVVDLGADELTVGRLHPMIDPELAARRLRQEAADDGVGVVLLDVVLGFGAHPDPAGVLAPAIADAGPDVLAVLVGTGEDPQGLDEQAEKLREAGASVFRDVTEAAASALERLAPGFADGGAPVALADLGLEAAINVGLETFRDSLAAQDVRVVHLDWRPPAGGDEKLIQLLAKMKRRP